MTHLQSLTLTYLLNSLWQLPLIFAAAWLAARILRPNGPLAEHRIWVIALFAEVVLPACPAVSAAQLHTLLSRLPWLRTTDSTSAQAHITLLTDPATAHASAHLPPHLLTAIAILYACSLIYFVARLAHSLIRTYAIARHAHPLTLPPSEASIWAACRQRFHLDTVAIAASHSLSTPVTLGVRRRVLLLPATLPSTLHPEDLTAALAHECAHMQRHDFAKNLAYTLLALPIAYHPLLWLTRARLAETREMVCDTLAAQALHGSRRYAHSLLRLASLFAQRPPEVTLNAIGIFDANIIERRVMNLTRHQNQLRGTRYLATLAACLVIACATCASALALHLNVQSPESSAPPAASAQTGSAPHVSARVINGQRLNFVAPVYPPEAKASRIQGKVVLSAIIGKDGQVASLHVLSGPPELTKAAWAAVKQWTYKPYLRNGQPVEVATTITVNFSLASGSAPDHAPRASGGPGPVADSTAPGEPTHPVFVSGPPPEHPGAARAEKTMLNGIVKVSLTVNRDGMPINVEVDKSLRPDFDQSAIQAVKQYRFKPALLNGSPVTYPLIIDVNFQRF